MSPSVSSKFWVVRGSGRADAGRARVAVPQLEAEELPDLLGLVATAAALLSDEPQQRFAPQEAGGHQLATHERVVDELTQVVGHPGAQRRAEGRLRAVDDLVGDPRPRGLLERRLLDPAVDLRRSGQRERR